MTSYMHTKEEIAWLKNKIKEFKHLTPNKIKENRICEEYNKKFNKVLTESGMYTWVNVISNPKLYGYKARIERKKSKYYKPRKSKNPVNVFIKSKYILMAGNQVSGFETEEELKNFLGASMILSGIKLFVEKPITIDYKISIEK